MINGRALNQIWFFLQIPVSVLYAEQRVPYSGPTQSHSITLAHSSVTGECKPIRIATSQSAQSLKSMSSFPIPRPFQPHIHGKNDQDNIPPPLLHDSVSSSANLGLKTPSAFFLSQHSVGHADAQLAIDHQAHYLSSCTAHSSKQDVQYSTKLPGGDVAQTVGSTSSLNSATDEKQFINMPFHAEAPVGQPIQILTHARDGTFVTDQQANEITYSTQMPVGLVSQQSKGLDISREASDHVTGKKHEFPSNSSIEADISDESKQIARDGVITASRHPAGISFSEEMKTKNMQNTERISDPLQTYDPAFQHRYSSTVQNPEYGAHSVQGLSDRARVDISDKSKQIGRDGVITASRHPAGISFSEEMKTQNTQSTERISDPLQTYDPAFQHRYSSTIQNPEYGVHSIKGAEHPSLQQGEVSGTACLQGVSSEQSVHNVADSLSGQQQKSSPYSFPTKNGVHNVPKDSSASEYRNSDPRSLQVGQSGVSPQDATFLPYSTNVVGHIVHSLPIDGDSMPKSAHMMQQSHVAQHEPDQEAVEHELAGKLQQLAGIRIFFLFFF